MKDNSEEYFMKVIYRLIVKEDNPELAGLIRSILREFKIDQPGTAYTDPTTDDLYTLFGRAGSVYWIAEKGGVITGGCGIYPTEGLPAGCAELVKFYVSEAERGKGIGKQLLEQCFESAKQFGYRQLYLETVPELGKAIGMYEKAGFTYLTGALGNSGHFFCNVWMIKDL
jgi:putative acetyltransferase